MIAEFAQDLINKLKTVEGLENRVGMAVSNIDPNRVPLPSAFVLFQDDESIEPPEYQPYNGLDASTLNFAFTVEVIVSYEDEADLLNSQLPLLEAIRNSVSGKESTGTGLRWRYVGQSLTELSDDRLVYALSFEVLGAIHNL